MQNNPELRSAMEDPENLRRSMQAAMDPDYMRAMMQQRDRAMNNLSSSSRGYNALQRHHDEISGPLMEAQTSAARRAAGLGGSTPEARRAQARNPIGTLPCHVHRLSHNEENTYGGGRDRCEEVPRRKSETR